MMKKIIIVGALLALSAGIVGFFLYNKPHQNMRTAQAAYSLTAEEIFSAFETDENAANEKYLGKIIQVSGRVLEVKKDEQGKTAVTLDGGSDMFGVICQLDDFSKPKRTEFTPGEQVVFQGECTGMLMDVVLVRCVEL